MTKKIENKPFVWFDSIKIETELQIFVFFLSSTAWDLSNPATSLEKKPQKTNPELGKLEKKLKQTIANSFF